MVEYPQVMQQESAKAQGLNEQETTPPFPPPTRLALDTGQPDDTRPHITEGHPLWPRALQRFLDARRLADGRIDPVRYDDEIRDVVEDWPKCGRPSNTEARAVTVELAVVVASFERILDALATPAVLADSLKRDLRDAPDLASPWATRPRLPRVYDPDRDERTPIVAMLYGPKSPKVGALLETIKRQDPNLADAIVLGLSVDALDELDRTAREFEHAARWQAAHDFQRIKTDMRIRAEVKRRRQRHEGQHYGWHSDNLPPGCLEAARAAFAQDVEELQQRLDERAA